MPDTPRRSLFWQVYPTLLGSLVLVAVLGAVVWHLFGVAPMMAGPGMRLHRIRAFPLHSLGMLLTVAAVVGLAAWPVVARITGRLERLRLSVEAWGAGEVSRRAAVDGSDEIAAVAASFNTAVDRADSLLMAHKALLAHASHELRSPLARLSLAIELLVGDDQGDLTASARREIAELDALVEEILLASRLDYGADLGEVGPVDLLALAAEEGARAGVALADVTPGAAMFEVTGSARLLRRLIRNLLDNALKHGAQPVEIELGHAILRGAPAITIAVHDHGRGVPAGLRAQVFEPFYRPAGASEDTGGWGLGLSLVRQIALRHGGVATCEGDVAGVTTFRVSLPRKGA